MKKKKLEILTLSYFLFKSEDVQKQNELLEKTKELYIKIITSFEQEVKSNSIELKEYNLELFLRNLEDRKKKVMKKSIILSLG